MKLNLTDNLPKSVKTMRARKIALHLSGSVLITFSRPEEIGLRPNPNYLAIGPQVDIGGFRTSGHLDTIKVEFSLNQRVSVNTARAALWNDPVITPRRRDWKKSFRVSIKGKSGSLTIQNPTHAKLRQVYSVFDCLGGLECEPIVHEAHFALDWRHSSNERRIQLATVLPLLINVTGLDLAENGTPRQFVKDAVSGQRAMFHARPSISLRTEGESRYGKSLCSEHYKPLVAAALTAYIGPRKGEHVRIYHKTWDAGREVAARDQVVRHERVFKSETLKEIGITTLASVFTFDARKLAPFFSYEVAALRIEKARSRKFERMMRLMKSGAFAVREIEGAPSPIHPRGRKVTLAHAPMNKRSNSAWNLFWGRWIKRTMATLEPGSIARISEISAYADVETLAEHRSAYNY